MTDDEAIGYRIVDEDAKVYEARFHRVTDDEALTRLETLIATQRPASTPWTPVTPFDYESRKIVEGIHPDLIWRYLIACDDADVLDYGCGPHGHLVRLLNERRDAQSQVSITGYDPQADESTWHLHRTLPNARRAVYDLVICREVLEHCTLMQMRQVVSDLCAYSASLIYVTTRFAKDPDHFLDVDTSDDLDPDHRTMLNQSFLRLLFVLEGFTRRADLEEKMDHRHLNRVLVYERV